MKRFLIVTKDALDIWYKTYWYGGSTTQEPFTIPEPIMRKGEWASLYAEDHAAAQAYVRELLGEFGWSVVGYDDPPTAHNEGVWYPPKRDWLIREVVDLGPGIEYRYDLTVQNLNTIVGCYCWESHWRVKSYDDPRYNADHATFYTRGRYRVTVRCDDGPTWQLGVRTVEVPAHSDESAGYAALHALWLNNTRVKTAILECVRLAA